MGSSKRKRGTYAGGGNCERHHESSDTKVPLFQPRNSKPKTTKGIYYTSFSLRIAMYLVVLLSFILTCYANPESLDIEYVGELSKFIENGDNSSGSTSTRETSTESSSSSPSGPSTIESSTEYSSSFSSSFASSTSTPESSTESSSSSSSTSSPSTPHSSTVTQSSTETPSTPTVTESSTETPSTPTVTESSTETPSTPTVTQSSTETPSTPTVTESSTETPSTPTVTQSSTESSSSSSSITSSTTFSTTTTQPPTTTTLSTTTTPSTPIPTTTPQSTTTSTSSTTTTTLPPPLDIGCNDDFLTAEANGLVNPSASGCQLDEFRRCSKNENGDIGCWCMTGYEETDTDKVCKEILKQASNITVEEKWNLSYCDSDSQLYKDLFDNIQKLYKKAAEDGGLSEEFQGFESMEVSPVNKPDACDSSTKIARRPAVPLSLTPKKRAKRNVQKNVNTKKVNSDSDNLLVKTQIVMRRTDNYDSSTNSALEDAVKNVIVNTTFDDEMGLTVDENSVSVGGVQDENCDDTSLCKERAECYLQEDTTLGAMKAKCRCLEQYEDISPSLISGELCVEPCTGKYCSYAGKCIRNSTYLTRYCSCNEWRIGDTCGVDMVGILLGGGIAIGILTIALLTVLITAVTSRRRRRRRNEVTLERDIATPVTTTPQIRGIYRLPSDSQVRVEQEHPSELQVPAPGLLPPHRGSPEQSVRSDPVPVHRDPRSDAWFVSQNIPRPRLSL